MSLNAKIDQDLRAAMTARDAAKLSTLRFLKSALKYAAIEKKEQTLSDPDTRQVIQKQIKQRRESIDQFSKGGRMDLVEKEKTELAVLEGYLPAQLSDKELEGIVTAAVKEAGAGGKKDFGRMMKHLSEKLAGGADNKRLSEILGGLLK